MRIALVLGAAALAAGCSSGSEQSVLHQGISPGSSGNVVVISDHQASRAGATTRSSWRRALERRAQEHPRQRFDNPPRSEFRRSLRALARDHGFTVISARVLRPRQDAPMVVVETTHYRELARSTASIVRALNPKDSGGDGEGWHYEGFYWEARDERGVPFLVASTLTRGQVEGQQWARSEALFPFSHG
jgi:hypothetical protein